MCEAAQCPAAGAQTCCISATVSANWHWSQKELCTIVPARLWLGAGDALHAADLGAGCVNERESCGCSLLCV